MRNKKRGNTGLSGSESPPKKIPKVEEEDEDDDEAPEAAGKYESETTRRDKAMTVEEIKRLIQTKHNREMMLLGQRWADPCPLGYLRSLEPIQYPLLLTRPPPVTVVPAENPLLISCVLKNLFTKMSSFEELPNLRLVCKAWNEELVLQTRKNPKYEVKLGNKVGGHNDISKFMDELQGAIHFPYGYFSFGHYLSKSCTTDLCKMFDEYGKHMKSIQFVLHVGLYITQGKFSTILDTLINLEELSICGFPSSITSSNSFIYGLLYGPPRLTKLKKFKLTHPGQDPYTKSILESSYTAHFLTILFKNAPNIDTLVLHWSTESKSSTITHFIAALSNAYKDSENLLNLELKCAITEDHINTLLGCKLKLESLSIGYLDHNVDRRTFEELMKKLRLNLKHLEVGDGSYESPEQFVWARGDPILITFPRMEELESLSLKCDGTHEFRKLGFTQVCFRTQFPALKSLNFIETPGSIDYIQKFLLPVPLNLTVSQKSYTVTKLQISGSLRLLRKGFFTARNFVKLLSKRFPALTALHMYYTTIDLLPFIWKYFKRLEDLNLVIFGSEDGATYVDEAITGVDEGVCKWFSRNPDSSADISFLQSICESRKRSICDLKRLKTFSFDIRDVGQTSNHRIYMTDSVIYFALVKMASLENVFGWTFNMTQKAVDYLKLNKVGEKLRTCDIKILIPRGYIPLETDDEIVSSDSEVEPETPIVNRGDSTQNDDFIMAIAVNYTDFEQDDANNSDGDDEDDDQDQDMGGGDEDDGWDEESDQGSNSDFDHDVNLDQEDNHNLPGFEIFEVDEGNQNQPIVNDVLVDFEVNGWENDVQVNDQAEDYYDAADENSQYDGFSAQFSDSGSGKSPPFSDAEDVRHDDQDTAPAVEDVVDQGNQHSNERFVLNRFFNIMKSQENSVATEHDDDSSVEEVAVEPSSPRVSRSESSRGRSHSAQSSFESNRSVGSTPQDSDVVESGDEDTQQELNGPKHLSCESSERGFGRRPSHRSPIRSNSSTSSHSHGALTRSNASGSVYDDYDDNPGIPGLGFDHTSDLESPQSSDYNRQDSDANSVASEIEESPLLFESDASEEEAIDEELIDVDSIDRVDYGGPDFEDKSSVADEDAHESGADELEELGDQEYDRSSSEDEMRKSGSESELSVQEISSGSEASSSDEN